MRISDWSSDVCSSDLPIDTGAQISFANFPSGGAGHRLWLGLNGPDNQDLLITATSPGSTTVNNDSDDIGADNQWINDSNSNPNELIRVDYVTNLNTGSDFMYFDDFRYGPTSLVNKAVFEQNARETGMERLCLL